MLLTENEHGAWVWVAVRLDDAHVLADLPGYGELSRAERWEKALASQRAWLTGLCDTNSDIRIELRYRTNPETKELSCAVLGRTYATDTATAAHAAQHLRSQLADLPSYTNGSTVDDAETVSRLLAPFRTHRNGIADIRKRLFVARPLRPDAAVQYYLAVRPFEAFSWDVLWETLLANPHPVVLSIGLQPYAVMPGVVAGLRTLAAQYGRLAQPRWVPEGLWSSGGSLAPDESAATAARLYAEAAQRYTSTAFRSRITLASPEPLSPALVNRIAGSARAVWPHETESVVAERNVTSLEHTRWDSQYLQELPEAPPAVVRLLAELVDPHEAAAVLHLPTPIDGVVPGFPVRRSEKHSNITHADNVENLIQAGNIDGGVHIYQNSTPLTPAEAVALLTTFLGEQRVQEDPQAVRELATQCGYLPHLLRRAGERAAQNPHLRLSELAPDGRES